MTYGELKTLVAAFLKRDDLTDKIPFFIHAAQTRLERKNKPNGECWKCMEAYATGTVSTDRISVPSSYKHTKWLKILDGDQYYPLTRNASQQVFGAFPESLTRRPEMFTYLPSDGEFLLRPAPDKSYTYGLLYYKYTDELSASADTNWWTLNAWEILLYGALMMAEPYMLNDERIITWKTAQDVLLTDLITEETTEDWSGSPFSISPPPPPSSDFTIESC